MVEYGHGVSQGTGGAGGGGGGGGGGSMDAGAALGQWINESVYTISTLPPLTLLAGFVVIVLGLYFLRRVL